MKKVLIALTAALLLVLTAQPAHALTFGGYEKFGSYTFNSGNFTVPRLTCGPTPSSGFIATWVGVSGNFLAQAGVSAWCNPNQRAFSVWYEDYPNPPHNFSTTPVAAGDEMRVEIDTAGSNVSHCIRNVTQGTSMECITTPVNATGGDRDWLAEHQGGQLPSFLQFEFKRDQGFGNGLTKSQGTPFKVGDITGCGGTCQTFWIRDDR